jgi:hypothetical protein
MEKVAHEDVHLSQQKCEAQTAGRTSSCASLSVVVVSTGSTRTTERATQVLQSASRDLAAQFIVVARSHDPAFAVAVERHGAEFVEAPSGSSRAEMCDLGMSRACGTIVAVRDDVSVGDAGWLDAYRRIVPKVEISPMVMETMVASRARLADDARALEALESGSSDLPVEMARAV